MHGTYAVHVPRDDAHRRTITKLWLRKFPQRLKKFSVTICNCFIGNGE
jgi:hypothetical protein